MQKRARLFFVFALAALVVPAAATAGHLTDPRTPNLVPLGHIEEPAVLGGFGGTDPDIQTDIAFWGRHAFQGNWDGFRIRDISDPANPTTVSRTSCDGNQGDILVYRNVLVRAWNTGAGAPGPFGAGLTCDGQPVAPGFEGVHVFDISNLADPRLVAQVSTPCGSHTATATPDPANNRLLVYSNPSSGGTNPPANVGSGTGSCAGFTIVNVPLASPNTAAVVRHIPLATPAGTTGTFQCHDLQVFLAIDRAACAGGPGFAVWSLGGPSGGTLENPQLLYQKTVPSVTIGHSAAFTWDGEILVYGHEPGGGVAAECEASDSPLKKSLFFYRVSDGTLLGTWTLPRPQASTENCTVHNFNTVPHPSRHILVHGSYQSGTGVVDFTSPTAAREIAWSDPPPRPVPPGTPFCCDVGGVWSSYWYNGVIYESHINEGLNIWDVNERWWDGAVNLDYLNPQTQEEMLSCTVRATAHGLRAGRSAHVMVRVRVNGQALPGIRVRLVGGGVDRTRVTAQNGNVEVALRPTRAGTLRIQVPDHLNMERCSTSARVAAAPRRGGLAPGGALTGRPG